MVGIIENLIKDKIFQFYYLKYFGNREYDNFYTLNDKEKINFLSSLYLYVSEKRSDSYFNVSYCNTLKNTEDVNYKYNLNETLEKLQKLKNESKKSEYLNRLNKINTLEEDSSSTKSNLDNILKKYSNRLSMEKNVDVNTLELRGIIFNMENNMPIIDDKYQDNNLELYIKEDNEKLQFNTQNILDADISINNRNGVHNRLNIPTYQSTFYKGNYNKAFKQNLENISHINEDFYVIDNREIFLIENEENFDCVISKNNDIPFKDLSYRKLIFKSKKMDPFNRLLFNGSSYTNMSSLTKKNFNKKQNIFNYKKKPIIEDLIIINETVSLTTEINVENTKKKCFFGTDLIDRIYFCPANSILVLDHNEAYKIGILLLESLRVESENKFLKIRNKNFIEESNLKFQEINTKYDEEKQKNEFLKNCSQKKLEIVYEYVNTLNTKLDYMQRLLNESNISEIDNSHIIESINKNLDSLIKNNENEFLEMNCSNTAIENQFFDDSTTKSIDFYVKKRLNNHNSNTQSQTQIRSNNLSTKFSPKI